MYQYSTDLIKIKMFTQCPKPDLPFDDNMKSIHDRIKSAEESKQAKPKKRNPWIVDFIKSFFMKVNR